MNSNNSFEQFLELITDSLKRLVFVKLIISNKRDNNQDLRLVSIKPVEIKKGLMLSFVYRHPTQDITKNFSYDEGKGIIKDLIENSFMQAELVSTEYNWHFSINKKNNAKLNKNTSTHMEEVQLKHDKQKKRLISAENNIYLQELGITDPEQKVKPSMQDKYKQINKYIEIIDGILKTIKPESSFHVVDMGAGKGYLTFALYDYLVNILKLNSKVFGVESRKELVDQCNRIAEKTGFKELIFKEGTIENTKLDQVDMLIALHACDTATDDAIFRGIQLAAKVIICAPCCHKQIRQQLQPKNELNLISQYGILKERQAEILTDTIRSQLMEAFGYSTKVFEFISTEHTPKNVMIVGIKKTDENLLDKEILEKISAIKKMHGIEYHYLEKLLKLN
jgi:SAM-dependent methyltransferase